MERYHIPYARPGQVIGLFGGSFDPPHKGHVHVTREAMKAFGLDRVWWLVSPGNPLKEHGPAPMARRLQAAKAVMQHPKVDVTDIEAMTGTRATADTLAALRRLYPQVRFVWLMGADNLAQFHRWKDWRLIMDSVPVGVVARPGDRISARMSPAARVYAKYRIDGQARHLLGQAQAPAWCFVNVPMVDVSSTEIRTRGEWRAQVLPE
ncbi:MULTISPECIES: nicotinate-nucleotide adenylyltransferase [unclassified Ruegeria]|uniref:nicotinate-nucleotide adenylyltransferase n=1 Tax=unclassified Ruegeria TaxID=2625375 RepID=UPI001489EEA9|nr:MULTISPECIES: nicotinate-nucleotide adenylyltransferase [unclassified Ruegeria]NOD47871.1 nicotinate-nucleotide adenylyltransferase [Ruegeria sp. HKCCD5849]NOD52855.1 nicotinate-nucleotide adenylyltransferase [Ruegeria sp. HKCCD5851]NOD69001.1 nicotinate-nucleotide adenylyltransferase [Ruegeria sp. HKCCD7303]NOE35302.1 nicotinate-nucleotide adenylyltransferase [Ruegeria sp. HKCCD7318]